jgi:hypothetical protein
MKLDEFCGFYVGEFAVEGLGEEPPQTLWRNWCLVPFRSYPHPFEKTHSKELGTRCFYDIAKKKIEEPTFLTLLIPRRSP